MAKSNGQVMQFIATPMGFGYSVEAQTTGSDSLGGLQVEVIPLKRGHGFTISVRGEDKKYFIPR